MSSAAARALPVLFATLLASALAGCGDEPPGHRPFIVIGVDGAELGVVRQLWQEDRLPHLRALAERGTAGDLRTRYGRSPVIWTTMATGLVAERHGIVDFVIPTESGDTPVASTLRQAPAIWNMLSTVGMRVAVLCWWATWPAEEINGILASDRILHGLDDDVWPPDWKASATRLLDDAKSRDRRFPSRIGLRDQFVDLAARELVDDGFDLLMLYFKSVDDTSHHYWKYLRPNRFPPIDPEELEANAFRIPAVYEEVDRSIGALVEAAGPEVNILVLSDHGFTSKRKEEARVPLDLDALLERLGYLKRAADGRVDVAGSRVFSYSSPRHRSTKYLRYSLAGRETGGGVDPEETDRLRAELERDLGAVRYAGGEPVFRVRDTTARERRIGADLSLDVNGEGATQTLHYRGEEIHGLVGTIYRISGTHSGRTDGLLIAAGPDIAPGADVEGIRIFDVTPTLLYGLGLPVAEDFDGRPFTALFTQEFQDSHPLQTVATWGTRDAGEALASEADEELLEELRALGYLD